MHDYDVIIPCYKGKQFIKKCPVGDCEGYLSTSWKCGVCNTKVCPECFVIKNKEHHQQMEPN